MPPTSNALTERLSSVLEEMQQELARMSVVGRALRTDEQERLVIIGDLASRIAFALKKLNGSESTDEKDETERHQVWAAPIRYGPWAVVGEHTGRDHFVISVEPIGSTSVDGEVKYYNRSNELTTETFAKQVAFDVGDSYANVQVRLKGTPTGSSCWVTVSH